MKYTKAFILIFAFSQLHAQSIREALRYSIVDYGATARNIGAGSSMGAFGADVSAIAANPAGIAEFRKSEFAVGINMLNSSVDGTLAGGSSENYTNNAFGLNHISMTFCYLPIASSLKTSNFSIGLNKIANFNGGFRYSGETPGSITERFYSLADGFSPDELDDFAAGPAYVVGAIFDFDGDKFYETDFDGYSGQVPKFQTAETKGGINELIIGWAGNLDHKVSIGFSLGLPFYSYEETKSYFEIDEVNLIDFFNELQYDEFLRTSGFGINGKFGIILKPHKQWRVSASFHSPSLYFLTDDFYTDITYSFTDQEGVQTFTEPSPDGNFKYRISTPWKALGGLGYIFGFGELKGFLSSEIEYIDYRSHSFNLTAESNNPGDGDLEDDLNSQMDNEFTTAINWRIGGELAYRTYRFRGGYQMNASPYSVGSILGGNVFSAGLGIRGNVYFLDLAFQYRTSEDEYSPYFLSDDSRLQIVNRDSKFSNIVLTFGYKI